jgi:hypothetical protein
MKQGWRTTAAQARDVRASARGRNGSGRPMGNDNCSFEKDITMKRFLASVLIAALGVVTIGCESQKGTTENKTETTVSQTKDGKPAGEKTITYDTKTTTTPAVPDGSGTMVKKTTETTTEKTK